MTNKTYLGLDMGVTSIGWALLEISYDNQKQIEGGRIIASGVRIFPATTEGEKHEPKNFNRRTSRGKRRLIARRGRRKNKLKNLLIQNSLLPKPNGKESERYFHELGDPYAFRARALREKLEPFELGRAIYSLEKRRGFKSNRKSGDAKEEGVVLGGIKELRETIEEKDHSTLGEFLVSQEKKRGRYISRKMIEDEFEKIWESQKKFYPEMLNDELKAEISQTIFFQRPLKLQRHLTGKCTFETDKKRCDMARQPAQRIRYWQDINNLKLQDENSVNWEFLSDEERHKLAKELEKKNRITFKRLRKILNLEDSIRINFEENDKKIKGNTTAYVLRKAIGKAWDELTEEKQERLIEEMFRIDSPESLRKRLKNHWNFDDEQIEKLLKANLETGYSNLSLKAINKILPKLIESGLRYDEAATEIYGDHRSAFQAQNLDSLPEPPKDLRNPIVTKALHELRKVINAIIREYGKPDEIRVELARDLKLNKKQKERVNKQNRVNRKENEEAIEFYRREFGVESVSYDDKLKYRLWKEAGEKCPYTGESIPPAMLLTRNANDEGVDIEHIIPYSRCFDNSYMNKTICLSSYNRGIKKNKTPFELFGENEQEYFEVQQRIESMPWAKRRRFEQKEVEDLDKMIGRQLSDTRYISIEARKYLIKLYDNEQKVKVLPGQATAGLRHYWGMNSILSDGDVDLKNRDDHRHHAIDAIVVALTNTSLFQYIAKLSKKNHSNLREDLKGIAMPWESFLTDVDEAIHGITISHAPTRRVRGQLFEELAYGATDEEGLFVIRKSLESLSTSNIKSEKIVDKSVREIIKARYEEFDGNMKKAFGNGAPPLFHVDGKTQIKKVRIYVRMSPETVFGIKDSNGEVYKYYPSAGNHHVELYEHLETEERKPVVVTRFEATANVHKSIRGGKRASPISSGLGENWRFLFSLCRNDYIEFIGENGELEVLRVQKMSGGRRFEITLRRLNDRFTGDKEGKPERIRSKSSLKHFTRKLIVDPLGNLTQAND